MRGEVREKNPLRVLVTVSKVERGWVLYKSNLWLLRGY